MKNLHDAKMDNPSILAPVNPAIEIYMKSLLAKTDNDTILAMEAHAREHNFPIVDRLVGIFLETQAKAIGAKRIFEFGSGFGYSAYWFARAVGADGQVICSDGLEENFDKAKAYLDSSDLWNRINFKTGIAQDIFVQTEGQLDICYNDVDKGDYPEIWRLAKDRIRSGGLYIADNVLWHGRVVMDEFVDVVPGWTEAIKEHNQLIFDDPEFDTYINPTRDGVLVARKK